jgi:uncharacterized membrane protein YcaP (DUF421 family)
MDQYVTIFSPIPWDQIGITFIQAFALFWLVLIGLRLVGRRTFSEMGAQEIILLLLISEATDLGITHGKAGFWGSVASVVALLLTVYIVDHLPFLQINMESNPVQIKRDGKLDKELLKKHRIEEEDLQKAARKYGVPLDAFESLTLEGDGSITGIVKQEYYRMGADR